MAREIRSTGKLTENRRAYFDYEILEKFSAGIELKGFEVKSIKSGRGNLSGSSGIFSKGEAWLVGVDIPPYQIGNAPLGYDPKRSRRLLLNKKEIDYLKGKVKAGFFLIPLKFYLKNNFVKVELGLGRKKRKDDKRETIKKEITKREMRSLK